MKGVFELLTTPELKGFDSTFPAENWFLYWKTSPSLWPTKMRNYKGPNPIFIPINWGYHSESPNVFDFGQYKPETDLKRIYDVAQSVGRTIIFLIPVTPAPFLPSGGIPSYLSRTLVLDEDGIGYAVLENSGAINKLYSYFDPKVFQAFRKFIWNLGQYFTQVGIGAQVCCLNSGAFVKEKFVSTLYDHSMLFENGFTRYLHQISEAESQPVSKTMEELKLDYVKLIEKLYIDAVTENFGGNFGNTVPVNFIGGSAQDLFTRSAHSTNSEAYYFQTLLTSMVNNIIPSTILLNKSNQISPIDKAAKDIVNSGFILEKIDSSLYDEDFANSFFPLVFFEIYTPDQKGESEDYFKDINLIAYLNREFAWTYRYIKQIPTEFESMEGKIYFFEGSNLTEKDFSNMLKIFMSGGRIFLDTAKLDKTLDNKLQFFMIENNLAVETIHFITKVSKASLGEGSLIIYDGEQLMEKGYSKRISFWEAMLKYLNLKHLSVSNESETFYVWKKRLSNNYELKYEEMRRLSLYNPTSYKKRAQIMGHKNFAYIKTVDPINAEFKTTPLGVEIELLPAGSISIDFGMFE